MTSNYVLISNITTLLIYINAKSVRMAAISVVLLILAYNVRLGMLGLVESFV